MFRWNSFILYPFLEADHRFQSQFKWDSKRRFIRHPVNMAAPVNHCPHYLGDRVYDSDVLVPWIVNIYSPVVVRCHNFRFIEQIKRKKAIFKTRSTANPSKRVNVSLFNEDPSHTVVTLVSYVHNPWILGCIMVEFWKLGDVDERNQLYPFVVHSCIIEKHLLGYVIHLFFRHRCLFFRCERRWFKLSRDQFTALCVIFITDELHTMLLQGLVFCWNVGKEKLFVELNRSQDVSLSSKIRVIVINEQTGWLIESC